MIEVSAHDASTNTIVLDRNATVGDILKGNREMANRLVGENPGVVRRIINTIKDFLKKLAGIEGPYIRDMQNAVDMLGNALNEVQGQQQEDAEKKYNLRRVNDPDYLLNGKEYFDYERNLSNRNYSNGQYAQRNGGGFVVDMGPLLVYSNGEGIVEHVLDVSDQTVDTASRMKDLAFDLAKGDLDFENQRKIIDRMSDKSDSSFRTAGFDSANRRDGRGRTAEYSEQNSGRNRTQVPTEGEVSDEGTVSDDWHARVYGTAATNNGQSLLKYSLPSDDTLEAMLRSFMANGGMLSTNVTPPGTGLPGPANTNGRGTKQRQFGSRTAQESNALHEQVKQYLRENSEYIPDTNSEQIDRAMSWVQEHATEEDPTGYYGALNEAASEDFNPYSADGQARMLTLMGMAALTGDAAAETRLADTYNKQGTRTGLS